MITQTAYESSSHFAMQTVGRVFSNSSAGTYPSSINSTHCKRWIWHAQRYPITSTWNRGLPMLYMYMYTYSLISCAVRTQQCTHNECCMLHNWGVLHVKQGRKGQAKVRRDPAELRKSQDNCPHPPSGELLYIWPQLPIGRVPMHIGGTASDDD